MNVELNPFAILSAVLFHGNDTRKVTIKPDDASPEQEIEIPVVGLQQRGEAIVCTIPLSKIIHFQKTQYNISIQIVSPKDPDKGEPVAVLVFEKPTSTASILGLNGKPVASASSVMQEVLSELTK